MASFNDLSEDYQYSILQSTLPKLDEIQRLIAEVDTKFFCNVYGSLVDPVVAQALEDAETAIGHVINKLAYKNKQLEDVLIKAAQLTNTQP